MRFAAASKGARGTEASLVQPGMIPNPVSPQDRHHGRRFGSKASVSDKWTSQALGFCIV
jgi:hypothetical protein